MNRYHATVCKWLQALGITYQEEYPVGQYSVDIYLPDTRVGVEIDGPQHRQRQQREHDVARDAAIERASGMRIVRVPVGTRKAAALHAIFGKDAPAG